MPSITIVTPSYNQGEFLEETIRSVLLQGYPNLEYFVMDGGSSDQSPEIIEKYKPWLAGFCHEPDEGQAHAINKGFARATGEIGAYLNSDDVYRPGALRYIGETYLRERWDIFVGRQYWEGSVIWNFARVLKTPFTFPFVLGSGLRYGLPQECVFWSRSWVGDLRFDESLRFCLDVWWFTQIYSGARVMQSTRAIGSMRQHANSKSSTIAAVAKEEAAVIVERSQRWYPRVPVADRRRLHRRFKFRSMLARIRLLFFPRSLVVFSYVHPPYR